MHQTWRWFGANDQVTIADIRQAGAAGVVSALHHVPTGDVWQPEAIAQRQSEIAQMPDGKPSSLSWDIVESLPVSEDIKRQTGEWRQHVANYKEGLVNLANSGINVVCYNFMPVLDWTRTDLAYHLPSGATCMRFDWLDFAVFDLHILNRPDAGFDYSESVIANAAKRFSTMTGTQIQGLGRNVVFGLPGAAENFSLQDIREHLAEYAGIGKDGLFNNLVAFLEMVAPLAQKLGIRLCCHPDDPPMPILGLPRIMSTEAQYKKAMDAVDIPANGITLCSGSLGVRPDNDLPAMMRRLGSRVHFLHLRNTKRESPDFPGSFHETEHLAGDTDMVALIAAVLSEEQKRRENGRADHSIPFRPDHGLDILDDQTRKAQPGYPAIGRLKGLAELRGIIQALSHPATGAGR